VDAEKVETFLARPGLELLGELSGEGCFSDAGRSGYQGFPARRSLQDGFEVVREGSELLVPVDQFLWDVAGESFDWSRKTECRGVSSSRIWSISPVIFTRLFDRDRSASP